MNLPKASNSISISQTKRQFVEFIFNWTNVSFFLYNILLYYFNLNIIIKLSCLIFKSLNFCRIFQTDLFCDILLFWQMPSVWPRVEVGVEVEVEGGGWGGGGGCSCYRQSLLSTQSGDNCPGRFQTATSINTIQYSPYT